MFHRPVRQEDHLSLFTLDIHAAATAAPAINRFNTGVITFPELVRKLRRSSDTLLDHLVIVEPRHTQARVYAGRVGMDSLSERFWRGDDDGRWWVWGTGLHIAGRYYLLRIHQAHHGRFGRLALKGGGGKVNVVHPSVTVLDSPSRSSVSRPFYFCIRSSLLRFALRIFCSHRRVFSCFLNLFVCSRLPADTSLFLVACGRVLSFPL